MMQKTKLSSIVSDPIKIIKMGSVFVVIFRLFRQEFQGPYYFCGAEQH